MSITVTSKGDSKPYEFWVIGPEYRDILDRKYDKTFLEFLYSSMTKL